MGKGGYEDGSACDIRSTCLNVNGATLCDGKIGYIKPFLLQHTARVQHTLVLLMKVETRTHTHTHTHTHVNKYSTTTRVGVDAKALQASSPWKKRHKTRQQKNREGDEADATTTQTKPK